MTRDVFPQVEGEATRAEKDSVYESLQRGRDLYLGALYFYHGLALSILTRSYTAAREAVAGCEL